MVRTILSYESNASCQLPKISQKKLLVTKLCIVIKPNKNGKKKQALRRKQTGPTMRSHASWRVLVFVATIWCCICNSLNKSRVSSTWKVVKLTFNYVISEKKMRTIVSTWEIEQVTSFWKKYTCWRIPSHVCILSVKVLTYCWYFSSVYKII